MRNILFAFSGFTGYGTDVFSVPILIISINPKTARAYLEKMPVLCIIDKAALNCPKSINR